MPSLATHTKSNPCRRLVYRNVVINVLGPLGPTGPTGPTETCQEVRNCFKYGPGPCGCRGGTIPCFANVGRNAGQMVCGPDCIAPQVVHPDCTRCINTCSPQPPNKCSPKQVPCFASCGPNLGKTVCAPKCPASQQQSQDCTSCVDKFAPSKPDTKAKGPAPAPAPKGKGPTPAKGKTSSSKDKTKKTTRRSLRQVEIDMMML